MKTRHSRLITLIALTVLLVAPQVASAASLSVNPPRALTAEARYDLWTETLQSLLASPDLPSDAFDVVWDALYGVDAGAFVDSPDATAKQALLDHTHALSTTLSCGAYHQAIDGFGPLGKWFYSVGIEVAPADCNCGDSGCAAGWTCTSVTCTSPEGTTHWGRCVKNKTTVGEEEPRPISP